MRVGRGGEESGEGGEERCTYLLLDSRSSVWYTRAYRYST